MKGIAGKQTRGLPTAARLHVADNTGAKVVQILNVLKLGGTMRRYPAAGVGDMAKVSVKKGTPDTRRQMYNAVIIRQRRPFRRVDGTWVQFEDNAVASKCGGVLFQPYKSDMVFVHRPWRS